MLSKIFGSSSKGSKGRISHQRSKSGQSPYNTLQARDAASREGKDTGEIVLSTAERQLYKHQMPQDERGFGDLLDAHEPGTKFPHAAIASKPLEDYTARMRRLANLQPRIERRRLDVPDHMTVKLSKPVEEFTMSSMLCLNTPKRKQDAMEYILVKRATFIFSPLSSFIDNHSDVIVSLVDMRKRTDNVARSLVLQDNKQYKGEFTLDYCFPRSSSNKLSMTFAQEIPTFDDGEQWGVCQIFLELEESDFPQILAFQETIGTASLTTSMLEKYSYHPAHRNLAIRDNHRAKLQGLYEQGDIVDETEAHHDRTKKLTYAKSSGSGLVKKSAMKKHAVIDEQGNVDWSGVREFKAPEIPDDIASIDPLDEDVEEADRKFIEKAEKGKKRSVAFDPPTRRKLASVSSDSENDIEPITTGPLSKMVINAD